MSDAPLIHAPKVWTLTLGSDAPPEPSTPPVPSTHPYVQPRLDSDSEAGDEDDDIALSPMEAPKPATNVSTALSRKARMFTQEELAVLPESVLDPHKSKAQAKKAKRRRAAAERTEGDLLLGFMDMGVERPTDTPSLPTKKQKMRAKKARTQAERVRALPSDREADEAARKEEDFARFLNNVGEIGSEPSLAATQSGADAI